MRTTEFDERCYADEDISPHVDWTNASRPGHKAKRVNVDFLVRIVAGLDR